MSTSRSRQLFTMLLVVGAVAFGMILAGSLGLTAPSQSDVRSASAELAAAEGNHPAAPTGLPSFADLAQAVEPAVVSIQAATIEKVPVNQGPGGPGGSDPFEFFFGPRRRGPQGPDQQQPQQQQPEEYRSDAGGSGFVISPDGLVVTNFHVIHGASEVKVHLADRDYTATVKGTDPATDIALLKIDAGTNLKYLDLGDSDQLRVGDWVMVIGNPLNLDKTVTVGVVSAKGRSLGISDASFENFIQTDAAINFGNSGGPLVNLAGQVVGIATAINYGAENIGFAVPVNTVREVLPQLKDKGKVSRGYLGIEIRNLDYTSAKAFGLESTHGALVGKVNDKTPAADAGVRHGDIILKVDGHEIESTRDLINYVAAQGPGGTVTLDILRDGKPVQAKVKLAERPGEVAEAAAEEAPGESGIEWLGLQYQNLTPGLRSSHGLPPDLQGIWVTQVAPSSPLYEENVRPGDVISEVNGQAVTSTEDFERVVKSTKKGAYLRLYVQRLLRQGGMQPFFAFVQVP